MTTIGYRNLKQISRSIRCPNILSKRAQQWRPPIGRMTGVLSIHITSRSLRSRCVYQSRDVPFFIIVDDRTIILYNHSVLHTLAQVAATHSRLYNYFVKASLKHVNKHLHFEQVSYSCSFITMFPSILLYIHTTLHDDTLLVLLFRLELLLGLSISLSQSSTFPLTLSLVIYLLCMLIFLLL